jgi:hypothetical protein
MRRRHRASLAGDETGGARDGVALRRVLVDSQKTYAMSAPRNIEIELKHRDDEREPHAHRARDPFFCFGNASSSSGEGMTPMTTREDSPARPWMERVDAVREDHRATPSKLVRRERKRSEPMMPGVGTASKTARKPSRVFRRPCRDLGEELPAWIGAE